VFAPSSDLTAGIWLIPAPAGVEPRAWHLLAIFVATIVGIILKPLPMGAIAMIGIAVTALTGTLTINQAQRIRQWYYLVDRCRLLYLPWLHQDWSKQPHRLPVHGRPSEKRPLD
jgi:di/tricarboxylate transporter